MSELIKLQISASMNKYPFDKRTKSVSRALPYYLSRKGKYIHRVRSADNHWRDFGLSHTSIGFWCGNSGFLGEKGNLLAKIPEGGVLCAVCEGKAIGAGLDGERKINGKDVMYSPIK